MKVVRKAFARTTRLRIGINQEVEVRTNLTTSDKAVVKFLAENEVWIEKTLVKMQKYAASLPKYTFAENQTFYYLGHQVSLQFADVDQCSIQGRSLVCPESLRNDSERIRQEIRRFYQLEAEQILPARLQEIESICGLYSNGLRLRDFKSQWGSCNTNGRISLSWKLIAAPIEVIDYVIIHELCHLVHFNHSKAFWALVKNFCPDYLARRKWLKTHALRLDFLEKKSKLTS